jgi:hypothetical protein
LYKRLYGLKLKKDGIIKMKDISDVLVERDLVKFSKDLEKALQYYSGAKSEALTTAAKKLGHSIKQKGLSHAETLQCLAIVKGFL